MILLKKGTSDKKKNDLMYKNVTCCAWVMRLKHVLYEMILNDGK